MEKISNFHISKLEEDRYFVVDDLLSIEDIQILSNEAVRRHKEKLFVPAKIGRGAKQQRDVNIRGDWTSWIDEEESKLESLQKYFTLIDELTLKINRTFFTGLKRFECHFSFYPEGTFYKKHVDQFQDQNARQLSCILYLNLDYKEGDGGELVIYSPQEVHVIPKGGRFVCFLTKDLPHEVLTCYKSRYALTGWIRND